MNLPVSVFICFYLIYIYNTNIHFNLFSFIGKKTKKVGKLLLQTSVRELHNDLIKSEKLGGLPSVWNNKKTFSKRYSIKISDTKTS